MISRSHRSAQVADLAELTEGHRWPKVMPTARSDEDTADQTIARNRETKPASADRTTAIGPVR
jgi:hypothetical protein